MNKGSLGIHQIELMIQTSPSFSDGGGIRQHADGTLYFGQITTWNNSWGLIIDTHFETSRTPVDELDGSVGERCILIAVTLWNIILRFCHLFVLIVAIAAFTSLGTTSPRYNMQQAMYLPCRGSHFTIWLAGSKQALVISATESCSW